MASDAGLFEYVELMPTMDMSRIEHLFAAVAEIAALPLKEAAIWRMVAPIPAPHKPDPAREKRRGEVILYVPFGNQTGPPFAAVMAAAIATVSSVVPSPCALWSFALMKLRLRCTVKVAVIL